MRGRSTKFMAAFQALLLMATLVLPALASAAVSTDQADYSPGSVVTISGDNSDGAGYLAGETVDVVVSGPNGYAAPCSAVADEAGAWSCQVALRNSELAVGDYSYTATGQTSGVSETGTFTDATQTTTTVASSLNPSGLGVSVTFTATVRNDTTNANMTTGSVKFGSGTNCAGGFTELQAATAVNGSGQVTYSTTSLLAGDTTVRACFVAPSGFNNSGDGVNQSVDGPPSVSSTTPASAATGVAVNANVSITFSESVALDPGNTISCATSGAHTYTQSGGPTIFTLDADVDFVNSETCTVTIDKTKVHDSDVTDPPDNMVANYVFSFTTIDAAPEVVATSPANGATGVLAGANVVITFSEPVTVDSSPSNWITVNCSTSLGHAGATTGGPLVFTFNPATDFTGGETCDVKVYFQRVHDVDINDPPDELDGHYDFSFTVQVTNTPPSVSVTGVADSGSYNKGSVPAAGCSIVDTEDGNSTFAAALSLITGPDLAFGIGSQTASCSYTDGGGLSASASATYDITDATAPSISYVLTPSYPDGDNGWFLGPVTLTWTVTEGDSPSTLVKTGCVDQNLTADQASIDYSCSATSAGGSAGPVTVSIKIDGTKPVASVTIDDTPNGAGWFNSTVHFTTGGTDNLSGIASCTDAADYSAPDSASATSASATCTDNAGNVSDPDVSDVFKYDATAPVITDAGPTTAANGYGWFKTDVINTFNLNADVSGPDATCAAAFPGNTQTKTTSGEGTAVTVNSNSCTDLAGNSAAAKTSAAFKIDLTDPSVAITSPATGLITVLKTMTVSGTASDTPSGIDTVAVNGGSAVVPGDGTFSKDVALSCGVNEISAEATDLAGRTSMSNSVTVTLVCAGSLQYYQPIDQSTTSTPIINKGKFGRVIPVKVTATVSLGGSDVNLTESVLNAHGLTLKIGVNLTSCENTTSSDLVEAYADAGSSNGNTRIFRWSASQWIYNLDTGNAPSVEMVVNHCYRLDVRLFDGAGNSVLLSTGPISGSNPYAIFKPIK